MEILNKFYDAVPGVLKPETNPVLNAFLLAFAESDTLVQTESENAKAQLFIRTASGRYLTRYGDSVGVSRPQNLGISDADFQELIPNLSLKPKQIRKAFYETADVFWGPLISRANVTTATDSPFNLSTGNTLELQVDNGETQTLKIKTGEVAVGGSATATEAAAIYNRFEGVTASVITELNGDEFLNVRTDTPGPTGALQFVTGVLFPTTQEYTILDQQQRFVLYPISANEITIEIPVNIPLDRDAYGGAHYFHEDSTLEAAVPPENGIWRGGFLFNPSGSVASYTVSSDIATLTAQITEGQVATVIDVGDSSDFEGSGYLLFGFGRTPEGPIAYRGVPNATQILIDPAHVFENTHAIGVKVNRISARTPYIPRKDGTDLPIYFVSPSEARRTGQTILERLAAAGVKINWEVLPLPDFNYLLSDPYSD